MAYFDKYATYGWVYKWMTSHNCSKYPLWLTKACGRNQRKIITRSFSCILRRMPNKPWRIPGNARYCVFYIHFHMLRRCRRRSGKYLLPYRCPGPLIVRRHNKWLHTAYRARYSGPSFLRRLRGCRTMRNDCK